MRRLHEAEKTHRRQRFREKALQRETTRRARVDWIARVDSEWVGWFDRTVFMDESVFVSSASNRRASCVSSDTQGRVYAFVRKSGRIPIAVLSGMCGNEVLPLVILPSSLTAHNYRDLSEEFY